MLTPNRIPTIASVGVLLMMAFAAQATGQATAEREASRVSPCAAPTSVVAGLLVANYRWLMGGNDTTRVAERALEGIPRVDPASVVLVSDTTVCRAAARAYTAALQDTTIERSVHVVKIGSRYLVMDPFKWAGRGPAPKVTFDSAFTTKFAQTF